MVSKRFPDWTTRLTTQPLPLSLDQDSGVRLKLQQEADRFLQQGIDCYQNSQFKSALQAWQQALQLYQEIGDFAGEANALSNLGVALQSLGQYQKAIARYQQSLVVKRESGEWRLNPQESGQTKRRLDTSVQHHVQGEYHLALKLAIEHFQKHLKLACSIGDRLGEANSLFNLGKAYASLGQFETALDYHQRSLEIKQQIGDAKGLAESFIALGQAYDSLEQYPKAIQFYQDCLTCVLEPGQPETGLALGGLGSALYCMADYEHAYHYYQQYLDFTQQMADLSGMSIAWSGLGNTFFCLKQYDRAQEAYQQSLALKQDLSDRFGEAIVLSNLSKVYHALDNEKQATLYQQKSLEIKRSLTDE